MTDKKHGITITARDRLMAAWQSSMELVRDFEAFAQQEDGTSLKEIYAEYAEDEGIHASKFRELLLAYEKNITKPE